MGKANQRIKNVLEAAVCIGMLAMVPQAFGAGGSVCGDLLIGPNEQCEDGNNTSGDGCSENCLIENNYQCIAPTVPTTGNVVLDPGFENGIDNSLWERFSSANEDVLCTPEICDMSFARQGAWWARFGSLEEGDSSFIDQRVEFPGSHRWLEFDLAIPECDSFGNTFTVSINQQPVRTYTGNSPGCGIRGYRTQRIDLETAPGGPYNDGSQKFLSFSSTSFQGGTNGPTVFWLDNVHVVKQFDDATPGSCELDSFSRSYTAFDPPSGGDLGAFGLTTFEVGDPIPWGTTDDGICGTGAVPPGNFTGGMGEAACLDASAAPGASILSYFCTEGIDFTDADNTQLTFLLNLQLGQQTSNDFFQILVGDQPPDAGSIDTYLPVFELFDSVGEFGAPPGQEIFVDLNILNGTEEGFVCFAFSSETAFYAQVDNVDISAECTDEVDEDKLLNCFDNCINVSNADQTDSDGDGYGNACDADISKPFIPGRIPTTNGNDCVINVVDLGVLRQAFFASPNDSQWNPDADFNNDQKINFEDLGIMRTQFFSQPGPSGGTNQCSP